jgi:transcriptional regulator with GAF, ATPase, and Fis domain
MSDDKYVVLEVPGTTLAEAEKRMLVAALKYADGCIKAAADTVGVTHRVFAYAMRRHGINISRKDRKIVVRGEPA